MNSVENVLKILKNGELEKAFSHINQIKKSESDEDILLLAEEITQLGFIEQGKDLFEFLHQKYPDEGEILLSLAEILTEMDQEDEAMLLLEQIDPEDDIYPSALLLEADLYQMQGMDEVSERKLLKAKQSLPDEILIDFALGELYYQQGKFIESIASFEKVLPVMQEVGGIDISQRMAEALSSSGQFEEALTYFDKALENKLEINTLFEYGLTAYQAGYYETAVAKFSELKELDPEYHSLYLFLARSYEHLEELELSLKIVKEGIKADEFNKELYFFGGKVALKTGREQEAEDMFREALALDPGYLEAALTLMKLLVHLERHEDVVECIESIRGYGEDDPQFDWLLAVSYQGLENYSEALNSYKKAYNAFEMNQDFLIDYGYFLVEEGDRAGAREVFSKLLSESPANEEYIMMLERLEAE
ncbi:hypothetical protein CVD28_17895 [Bacillus sp. M6-12]|uniref:tetratricopeptide repeat protein n=1 Tax=Bacillus sp. M6-12 TaxID=2054166 RepID=UPI000C766EDA|nr:tetratricopeptide repeat protein [Bacillus sp. M6-12]PLS16420.1 hypothetical protein CVD28_17895 [Bacillus sp. M6-12]